MLKKADQLLQRCGYKKKKNCIRKKEEPGGGLQSKEEAPFIEPNAKNRPIRGATSYQHRIQENHEESDGYAVQEETRKRF